MKTLSIFLTLLILTACSTTKKLSPEEQKVANEKAQREQAILDAGYARATVKDFGGEDRCCFLLELEDGTLLNPISWIEGETFRKAGSVLWIKYRISKAPQNGCTKSKPIVLEEAKFIDG